MNEMIKTPEFLFESSWEVCNKVGGIYTVLSTKAHTLQQIFNDKVIFIGPDVWANTTAPDFTEDASLFEDWRKHAEAVDHLKVKVGRWNVPPFSILCGKISELTPSTPTAITMSLVSSRMRSVR